MARTKKNTNNKVEKKIPMKNYLIAALLLIGIGIVTMYGFRLYKLYQEEKVSECYLLSSNTITNGIKNLEELNSVLTEAPTEFFIYISYTGDKEIYKLEENLKELIDAYNLQDEFYYLNINDIKDNDDYLDKINNALDTNVVNRVPIILYFKDNKIVTGGVVSREDGTMMQAGDFGKLLDQFEFGRRSL